MPLTIKQIKNSLGRVKPYYQHNDIKSALEAIIYVLENLSGATTVEVRSALRESIQTISQDAQVKKFATAPAVYQPGHEADTLILLLDIFKKIKEEDSVVSHQEKLERKLNLDRWYNEGIKALKSNNASMADESFAQSLTFYVDEHQIFYMMALALKEAGEIRRSLPYAKRGLQALPNSKKLKQLLLEIIEARNLL